MRIKLLDLGSDKRHTFTARISRFGTKTNWNGYPEETVCLADVRILAEEEILTDHLWFTCGKTWKQLNPKVGDLIQFEARVSHYTKWFYHQRWLDYKLARPTKMKILQRYEAPLSNSPNTKETYVQAG